MSDSYQISLEIDDDLHDRFDAASVVSAVEAALRLQHVARASLTLVVTSDEVVQELNRDYRGVDAPTDVLSFSAQADEDSPQLVLPAEMPEEMAAEMADYLGDIIIAFPYALHQADHYANSIDAELRLLAVHGVLHLLGYDHATPDQEAEMWAAQELILAIFGDQKLSQRQHDA